MPTYDVKFPDGHTQTFTAPVELSDADAYTRAVQERSIAEGKTPTTYEGGRNQALKAGVEGLAEGTSPVSLLMGIPGMLTGTVNDARNELASRAQPFDKRTADIAASVEESKKPHPGDPRQSGQALGSLLLGSALGWGVPKVARAAARTPTAKAISAVAGDLPVVGKTVQAFSKGAEAYRQASKPPIGEETLPITGNAAERLMPEPPGGPNIVSTAREPQPLSSFGTLLNPDALTPADIAANMKSAQLLKSPKPSSIAELLEAQAAPESLTLQSGAPIAAEELLQLIESLRQGRH